MTNNRRFFGIENKIHYLDINFFSKIQQKNNFLINDQSFQKLRDSFVNYLQSSLVIF